MSCVPGTSPAVGDDLPTVPSTSSTVCDDFVVPSSTESNKPCPAASSSRDELQKDLDVLIHANKSIKDIAAIRRVSDGQTYHLLKTHDS